MLFFSTSISIVDNSIVRFKLILTLYSRSSKFSFAILFSFLEQQEPPFWIPLIKYFQSVINNDLCKNRISRLNLYDDKSLEKGEPISPTTIFQIKKQDSSYIFYCNNYTGTNYIFYHWMNYIDYNYCLISSEGIFYNNLDFWNLHWYFELLLGNIETDLMIPVGKGRYSCTLM